MTNVDLGKVLNCTPQNYGRMESGQQLFSIENLIKLSNYYKVSINYILGNTTDKVKLLHNYQFDYGKMRNQMINLRINNEYSQDYIADEILNISQSMYSQFETGVHMIDVLSIMKLAALYNVPISYILGLDGQE